MIKWLVCCALLIGYARAIDDGYDDLPGEFWAPPTPICRGPKSTAYSPTKYGQAVRKTQRVRTVQVYRSCTGATHKMATVFRGPFRPLAHVAAVPSPHGLVQGVPDDGTASIWYGLSAEWGAKISIGGAIDRPPRFFRRVRLIFY